MEKNSCLICECHLVDLEELKLIIQDDFQANKARVLTKVSDFKDLRIIGHGCGQCLKIWELELEQLLNEKHL